MKKFSKALTFATLVGLSMTSQAYTLSDTYIGGVDHNYGDIIGESNIFDVQGLNVSYSGSNVTIDIYTNFANPTSIGVNPNLTYNGLGIGSGDLFLSNSYTPYGNTVADNASNGNLWTYGLSLDNAYSATGGSASLYALNGATNDENALLSEDFISRGAFRNGQEVAVDTQSASTDVVNTNGSWSVDSIANKISFNFDTTGTDLLSTGDLALHWGMLCGNDVIEGVVEAPTHVSEPSIAALFGLGLLGLGFVRRRA